LNTNVRTCCQTCNPIKLHEEKTPKAQTRGKLKTNKKLLSYYKINANADLRRDYLFKKVDKEKSTSKQKKAQPAKERKEKPLKP
jgi:hypothetical protein